MADLLFFQVELAASEGVKFYDEASLEATGWYRYEDSSAYHSSIHLRRYRVLRETPKGVWLDDYGLERFVLKDAVKRWAYPTIELAQASFLIRKRKQVAHLENYLAHAKAVRDAAEKFFNGTPQG
ncbi:hypothetical protein NKK48_01790 [Mesorhizobium sp. C386A]|uniref:hypothetical protein n=1 Tax=unclassified Mesorhizobium TaxID=325217 RepID=UPI0003CF94AB|nr:hypothetical protein [Mesorhizobium sp. LNJC386A00]ESY35809.1 hypothetical protein X748_14485 [Mesorhizobium sp. LNJC386A00]